MPLTQEHRENRALHNFRRDFEMSRGQLHKARVNDAAIERLLDAGWIVRADPTGNGLELFRFTREGERELDARLSNGGGRTCG